MLRAARLWMIFRRGACMECAFCRSPGNFPGYGRRHIPYRLGASRRKNFMRRELTEAADGDGNGVCFGLEQGV